MKPSSPHQPATAPSTPTPADSEREQLPIMEVAADEASADLPVTDLQATIDELTVRLVQAEQDRLRALADYQNLQRRTADDRQKMVKLATQSLVEDLLEHFDHLSMAAAHLQDKALSMIVEQLWKTLAEHGMTELDVLGKPFDPLTMEVVEHSTDSVNTNESGKSPKNHPTPSNTVPKVTKVLRRGYLLNGVVLRVAKVVVE